jgi:outer membrane protein
MSCKVRLLTATAVGVLAASPVLAETLADAIVLTYQSNPTLQSGRAQLKALNETYVQAKAGWRPSVSVQVAGQYLKSQSPDGFGGKTDTESNTGQASLTVSQPIYTGGRTATEVRATEADILAGREQLRALEDGTLQAVIQAYADVLRDQHILGIREQDLSLLQSQLDDAQARFKAGEITRTDVEQSQTQLAASRALLSLAQGQLQVSRAEYMGVVGQNPGQLAPLPALPAIPDTVEKAFDAAEAGNPALRRAQITEQASRLRIAEARAAYRPEVSVQATLGYTGVAVPLNVVDFDRAFQATATISQPIFTGGVNGSNVRRAIALNESDRVSIEAARRAAVQTVSQAWNQMLSTRASAVSDVDQIKAARLYFEDTQAEYRAGQRTTLDVLVAEQSLRDAQIALAGAEHDRYVAEAGVLAALGRLEVDVLVDGARLYDPAVPFRRVRDRGATPWEGLVAAVDTLGAPGIGALTPISGPPPSSAPLAVRPAGEQAITDTPATLEPTTPFPDTTSGQTPATVGQTGDEVAASRYPQP